MDLTSKFSGARCEPTRNPVSVGGNTIVASPNQQETGFLKEKTPQILFQQWIHRTWYYLDTVLRGKAFILLTGFGLISLVIAAMGTRSFNYSNPSTDILIHSANIYLEYIFFAIIVVYSGELVWRDRQLRLQAVVDATPVSNATLLLSKLTALFAIITINLLLAMAVMVAYQILNGYYYFQFYLYFQMLFVEHGPYFYLTAILAIFTQVVTRHKYAGMQYCSVKAERVLLRG